MKKQGPPPCGIYRLGNELRVSGMDIVIFLHEIKAAQISAISESTTSITIIHFLSVDDILVRAGKFA
jgi:hypothetical protein